MKLRRIIKIIALLLAAVLLLFGLLLFILDRPATQRWLTPKLETWLEEKLQTHVEVKSVGVQFPKSLEIKGLELDEPDGDTLLRVGSLVVDVDMWWLFRNQLSIKKIGLEDAVVKIDQRDGRFNFDFIIEAFAPPEKKPSPPSPDEAKGLQVVLRPFVFNLKNVSLGWQDFDNQQFINAKLGASTIKVEEAAVESVQFSISNLDLEDADISIRQLSTAAPDSLDTSPVFDFLVQKAAIARTHFFFEDSKLLLKTRLNETSFDNLHVWSDENGIGITSETGDLRGTDFAYRDKTSKPTPGRFNPADLELSALEASISQFNFRNDSLQATVKRLTGREKSGVFVQQLKGDLAYAPNFVKVEGVEFEANSTKVNGSFSFVLGKQPEPPISNFAVDLRQATGTIDDVIRFLPPDPSLDFLKKMAGERWSAHGKVAGTMQQLASDDFRLEIGAKNRLHFSGNAANFDQLDQLDADIKLSELRFDKSDFTSLLKGKYWKLPAFANATGSVKGRSGNLSFNLAGTMGNLDSVLQTTTQLDTARFNVEGTAKGIGNLKTLEMDLELKQFDVPGRMVAAFVPQNLSLPTTISVKGTANGSLRQLSSDLNFELERAGQTTQLKSTGTVRHLDITDSIQLDLAINGVVTKAELFGYLPDSLITPYVNLPASFSVEGTARGPLKDLRAAAIVGMGELGDLQMNGFLKGEQYSVNLVGRQLKVSELAADSLLPQLRSADFAFHAEGQGFEFGKTATVTLGGVFHSVKWADFTFKDLELAGQMNGGQFEAKLVSPDPRLHLNLAASGDLSGERPSVKWDGVFDCLDLDALGITGQNTSVCLRMSGQAVGLASNDLEATVQFQDLNLHYESQQLKPGDVELTASFQNGRNDLAIASDWLNAWLKGQFDPAGLPQLVNDFSQHYFTTDNDMAGRQPANPNDSLAFGLTLSKTNLFTTGVVPDLHQLDEVTMTGSLDASSRRFNFSSNLNNTAYDVWTMKRLELQANGDGKTANIELKIPSVQQYEEAFVRNLTLAGKLDGKTANLLLTALDSVGKERFKLGVFAETDDFENGYTVHLSPEQVIDYKPWALPADNSISLVGTEVAVRNLHFTSDQQSFRLDGTTRPSGTRRHRTLDFKLDMQRINLATFEVLTFGSLKDLAGWTSGSVLIGGTTDAPKPSGSLQLNDAKATVVLTNVRYSLSDKELVFMDNGLDLTGLTISDPQGNRLSVTGMMKTSNWKDVRYDLFVSSTKWLVLDTRKGHNSQYYGRVIASASGTVKGPLAEPIVTLNVKPLDGSTFYYIYDPAQEQGTVEGVVRFVRPAGLKTPRQKTVSRQFPLQLNMNLEIDEELTLNVVTDPGTGDFFEGTLEGRIALEMYPDGNMNLAGRCEVKTGSYRYSYQNVVKRRFEVAPGSYLAWSGDPFNPDLQITARYVVRTSPAPLLALSGIPQDNTNPELNNYQTFFLNFKVTNNLARPELKIDIEYPDDQTMTQNGRVNNSENATIQSAVTSLNNDEVQLSQQVFGLLMFNGFIAGGVQLENASLGMGLNDFLTSQFNALAGQYIKFVDVSLQVKEDVTFNSDNQSTGTTNYNLSLQKSFLNDRLTFKVSGGAEEDRTTTSQWSSSLENALVEYTIKPNGGLKIRAFSEEGLELLNSDVIRNSGAGLVFTKEFKTWKKNKK